MSSYGSDKFRIEGTYFTKTLYSEGMAVIVGNTSGWHETYKELGEYLGLDRYDEFTKTDTDNRTCGIRLVMQYDSIDSIPNNGELPVRADDGVLEVEYGYLPCNYVNDELENKLDNLDKKGKLIETPYEYTTDGRSYCPEEGIDERPFLECKNKVYEYKGKFYAKVYNATDKEDKERYSWKSIEPVKWWIDEETKLMITEQIVYGGIEFRDIDMFFDKYLSKELTQVKERNEIEIRQKYEPSLWNKLFSKKDKIKALPEGTFEIKYHEVNEESGMTYENAREEQFEKTQYLEERIRQASRNNAKEVKKVAKVNTIEKNEEAQKVSPIEEKVNNILDAQMNREGRNEIARSEQPVTNDFKEMIRQAARTDRIYYVKGEDGELYPTRDLDNSDYYIGQDGVLKPNKEPIEEHKEDSKPTNNQYVAKITADYLLKKPERKKVDLPKPMYEPKRKKVNPEEQDDGNER